MTLQYKRSLVSALLSGACLFSGSVLAQDIGWYMGGAIGQSKFDTPGVPAGFTATTTDDEDSGFKIYGGYQYSRNLAVEVGYVDLGGFSVRGTPTFNVEADVTGVTAAAVGTMPLNGGFSLFGKAGVIFADISASSTGALTLVTEDGTEFLVSAGARYNLNRNLAIQAEWEYFGGDIKTNFLSLGLHYKF
jgi:OOP family OmpA-OmpF porin